MRFELTTPTLARLCSTPELRPHGRCVPTESGDIDGFPVPTQAPFWGARKGGPCGLTSLGACRVRLTLAIVTVQTRITDTPP